MRAPQHLCLPSSTTAFHTVHSHVTHIKLTFSVHMIFLYPFFFLAVVFFVWVTKKPPKNMLSVHETTCTRYICRTVEWHTDLLAANDGLTDAQNGNPVVPYWWGLLKATVPGSKRSLLSKMTAMRGFSSVLVTVGWTQDANRGPRKPYVLAKSPTGQQPRIHE